MSTQLVLSAFLVRIRKVRPERAVGLYIMPSELRRQRHFYPHCDVVYWRRNQPSG